MHSKGTWSVLEDNLIPTCWLLSILYFADSGTLHSSANLLSNAAPRVAFSCGCNDIIAMFFEMVLLICGRGRICRDKLIVFKTNI